LLPLELDFEEEEEEEEDKVWLPKLVNSSSS
jgi:hypothetical protein